MAPAANPDARLDGLVRTIQIIAGAVMAGLIAFTAVAVVMALDKPPDGEFGAMAAAVLAGGGVAVRFVLPGVIAAGKRRQLTAQRGVEPLEPAELFPAFQTKTIVEYGVLEGPGFFAGVALMNTAQWWLLAVVAVLLAIMAAGFPTRGRFDDWADNQRQLARFEGTR